VSDTEHPSRTSSTGQFGEEWLPAHLQHQPQPVREAGKPDMWPLVIEDMKARDEFGRQKYGGPLQPFDGRDNLADVYQELLDACVYMRKLIFERDGK
jgi:hypothetical protein